MVSVIVNFCCLKIYLEDTLHLQIRRSEIIAIHAYLNGENYYVIEYQTPNTIIKTEYQDIKVWKAILDELDNHKIIIDESK